jgi:hypothetical protein
LNRFILFLALGAGLLSGCSETQTSTTRAELAGTYDLALVGRYLFVTSSDMNELRVLDLEASPRNFVKAPNPLEPLSIPVLERPSNLTRDVLYTLESGRVDEGAGGPYIYARSFGSQELSVVAADPAFFQERHRLTAQGLVTAFAARTGDEIIREPSNSGGSVLYYAQQTGRNAKLFRVELPKPDTLTKGSTVTSQALDLDLTNRAVTALLVLPPPASQHDQELLVVATRNTDDPGGTTTEPRGETFRVTVTAGAVTEKVPYDFGHPVRLLATHPRAEKLSDEDWHTCSFDQDVEGLQLENPPPEVSTGEYVFGVLDESSCGGEPACLGVVAVEAATGARAKDASGRDMLPISMGQALPTGLTLAARVDVNLPCQLKDEPTRVVPIVKRPLVGIVPMSNGTITLFDAVRMRPFDLDPAKAGFVRSLVTSEGVTQLIDEDSSDDADPTKNPFKDLIRVKESEGVTLDNTYRLLFEAALPGLGSVDRADQSCTDLRQPCFFKVDADAATRVEVGDVVVLRGDAGTCKDATDREVEYKITRKDAAADNLVTLHTEAPNVALPEGCRDLPRFSVRASGDHPFVVFSNDQGYRGRLAVDQPLEVPGSYYYSPGPVLEPSPKQVIITPIARLNRGEEFVVTTLSHFRPYAFGIDTTSVIAGLAAYRLPGPVVYTRVGEVDFAYIAYPSADGILQVSLEAITENSANTTGLVPFE